VSSAPVVSWSAPVSSPSTVTTTRYGLFGRPRWSTTVTSP
jgi:hypothetical protein